MQDTFREDVSSYFDQLQARVSAENGDWTVKGFIDVFKRIYSVSLDTKVLSKVLELLLFPVIAQFAEAYGFRIIPASAQNHYPDLSLVSIQDESLCYAIDIKTTYRTGPDRNGSIRVNGMTLGTFGGYFRNRNRPVSSTFAYNRYTRHYVLGVVYSRAEELDERRVYDISELDQIPSVARDFQFFFHEKYRIASDGPDSGNTRNIGSTRYLDRLLNGTGVFSRLGIAVFDDYWMNYQTRSMARESGLEVPPYSNLITYQAYKQRGAAILNFSTDELESEMGDDSD